MDLSLNEGTPLLAVAVAEVIAKGEGGLPFWTFVKYQHLSEMPPLETGARVMPGQVVARSGSTGTAGGHYGAAGYPHLHLSTHYGPSGEFTVAGMFASLVKGSGAELGDPMRLYLAAGEVQPGPVPAMRGDGVIVPAGSRPLKQIQTNHEKSPQNAGFFLSLPGNHLAGQASSPCTLPGISRNCSNGPMTFIASPLGPSNLRRPNIMARMGPYSPAPISFQRVVSACIL